MKPSPGSIKRRIFLWSLGITSAVLILLSIFLYWEIRKSILSSVQHTLHAKIQILKGLLHEEHGMIELELAEVVSGEYSIPRSGHYYKVIFDNDILAASPSLPDETFDLASGRIISLDKELKETVYLGKGPANEDILVVQHDFVVFEKQATAFTAQSLEESLLLIQRFGNILFGAVLLNVIVLALASLWITRKATLPLQHFSDRIEKITHRTMSDRIQPELHVDEIQSVARAFNAMLERLEKAFTMEKRLVADASHELKTPLSVIKAQCDVLLQRDRTKEEYTAALEKIGSTSDAMKTLITDMLSLASLDAGMLSSSTFSDISLAECIDRAVKLVAFFADKKQITLSNAASPNTIVSGDADALTELFVNILDNAIKYSPRNSSVQITEEKEGSDAVITLNDSGRGIEKEDLKRIFERFYRADTARGSEGTGLGLSIARSVAEAHGGTIAAESEPGRGSTFTVRLPLVITD